MDGHEIDLIRRAQAGEAYAFDALVRLHDRRILQVAYGVLRDEADAADAAQNAFIRAYRHLHTFRFESAFGTWLTRIAINQALNLRKKRRWAQRLSLHPGADEPAVEIADASAMGAPEQRLLDREINERLAVGLKRLSERERTVFILKHQQGYKIREIADMLACAEGTVKNYLFRATKKLRAVLQPYYEPS